MNRKIPAVSIIIPMYNAEKYIGECLDSILAQTFQDFEVIVVDDCSTDSSRAVVESYVPKFSRRGVKLNLICLKNNSGNPAKPTNMGINISRGEYLFILDNDDAVTPTALEELYPLAKKFNADVVYCENYYEFPEDGNFSRKNCKLIGYQRGGYSDKPILVTDDLAERTLELINGRFIWPLWSKFFNRDFILFNALKLLGVMSQDLLFTCCMILAGARCVRVPNVVNFYRVREASLYHESLYSRRAEKILMQRIHCLNDGFKYFDEFLNTRKFFQEHSDVKHLALEIWIRDCVKYVLQVYAQIPTHQLNEFIRREFEKFHDNPTLTAFLFSRMNVLNVNLNHQGAMIQQMNAHIQQQNQIIRQQQEQIQQLQAQIQK